jgi:hypothetical protein
MLTFNSDIVAELQLPQSGILAYESQMPWPNGIFAVNQGVDTHVAQGYLAQLYLRKQLNKVHNLLYDPEKEKIGSRDNQAINEQINEIQSVLKSARDTWVPASYKWNDDDPLPQEILGARLRAKYWGSQVILYRPFLRNVLDGDSQVPSYLSEDGPHDAMGTKDRTIENAKLGIRALIESTRAFHGLDNTKRIIVTNVFGTAHA